MEQRLSEDEIRKAIDTLDKAVPQIVCRRCGKVFNDFKHVLPIYEEGTWGGYYCDECHKKFMQHINKK